MYHLPQLDDQKFQKFRGITQINNNTDHDALCYSNAQ